MPELVPSQAETGMTPMTDNQTEPTRHRGRRASGSESGNSSTLAAGGSPRSFRDFEEPDEGRRGSRSETFGFDFMTESDHVPVWIQVDRGVPATETVTEIDIDAGGLAGHGTDTNAVLASLSQVNLDDDSTDIPSSVNVNVDVQSRTFINFDAQIVENTSLNLPQIREFLSKVSDTLVTHLTTQSCGSNRFTYRDNDDELYKLAGHSFNHHNEEIPAGIRFTVNREIVRNGTVPLNSEEANVIDSDDDSDLERFGPRMRPYLAWLRRQ